MTPAPTRRRLALLMGGLTLMAGFLACDSSPAGVDPESQAATLTVDASVTTIPIQGEAVLSGVLRNRAGNELDGRPIRWGTHTPSLVSVDSIGRTAKVRGLSPGTARIWASSSGVNAEVEIVVTGNVDRVEVTPATHSMPLGTSQQFHALVRDAQGNPISNPIVAWSTTDASILAASQLGVITAAGIGSAQVTATVNGRGGSAQVTVTPTAVATITVAPSRGEVTLGRTIQLLPTLKDASDNLLTGRPVTWESSRPTVLEVSASGLGTAHALGTVTVTASSEGKSGTAQVSVIQQSPLVVEVFPAAASINPGDSLRLQAVVRNSAGEGVSGLPVTWASSNPAVAVMTRPGWIAGVSPGVTTITAIVETYSGNTELSVRSPVPVLIGLTPDTVTAGHTSDLAVTLNGSGFTPISRVRVNGTDRPTEYQSATRLRTTLTPADLEEGRSLPVTVHTPAPGGGTTLPLAFQVKPRFSGVIGDTVEDEIRPAGDIDEIRFESRAGQEVNLFFQGLSGSNERLWAGLFDAYGNLLGSVSSSGRATTLEGQGAGPIRLPHNGMYTLRIGGENRLEQGRYRVYLMPVVTAPERMASPIIRVGEIVDDEEIAPVGDVDELVFAGTKGQRVNVFFQGTSGSEADLLELSIRAPNGAGLGSFSSYGNDRELDTRISGRIALPLSGTYTLRIAGHDVREDGGPYRLQVVPLDDRPETLPDTFSPGPVISGEALSPRGDVDIFTFNGKGGDEVHVFFQPQTGRRVDLLGLSLWDPDDEFMKYAWSRGDAATLEEDGFGPVRLPRTGRYSVMVEGDQDEKGPYRFRVMPVNLAPESRGAAVSVGQLVEGESIAPVGDVDQFTFTAARGQAVSLMFQATSSLNADVLRLSLRDPAGREVSAMTSRGDDSSLEEGQTGRIVLTQDGTYTIRVQACEWNSRGPYRFRLVPLQ